jgi:hypothetical protein
MRDVLEDDVVSHYPYSPTHRDHYFHEERLIYLLFDAFHNDQNIISVLTKIFKLNQLA